MNGGTSWPRCSARSASGRPTATGDVRCHIRVLAATAVHAIAKPYTSRHFDRGGDSLYEIINASVESRGSTLSMMLLRSQSSWLRRAIMALVALALLLVPMHRHDSAAGDGSPAVAVHALDQSGSSSGPQPDGSDHKPSPCPVCLLLKQVTVIGSLDWPEPLFGSIDRPSEPADAAPSPLIADLFRPPIAIAA